MNLPEAYLTIGAIIGVYFVLRIFFSTIVVVKGNEIAILERRYVGKPLPDGRVIAMSSEIGMQARVLGPGLYYLIPFLHDVRKAPFTIIAEDEIGIIESVDGSPIPQGHIFAKVIDAHNTFQDGEAFLLGGGQKGPQVQIIPPGSYRINTALFKVTIGRNFYIPPGQIGIITSMDGEPMTPGRLLAKHIEGHGNFENGQAFLNNSGQRGPQIDVLMPGVYRINTSLFKIELRPATVIPVAI